jgi:hypothetical protein
MSAFHKSILIYVTLLNECFRKHYLHLRETHHEAPFSWPTAQRSETKVKLHNLAWGVHDSWESQVSGTACIRSYLGGRDNWFYSGLRMGKVRSPRPNQKTKQ